MVWTQGNSARYLLVEVTAPLSPPGDRQDSPPLNLALVIDRSGSMNGARLAAAQRAAAGILEALTENDTMSLVSFDQEATTHLRHVRVDAAGRARLRGAIESLECGGTTDLVAGWLSGARCVAEQMEGMAGGQHRVLVLSDGHANQGILDPREIALHADELRHRGLYTSTVGIGDDYSMVQLQVLADHGGGRMHDAERPEEIIEVVIAELKEIREATAEDVAVQIEFPPQVQLEMLGTYPFAIDAGRATCEMGALLGGSSRQVVFKIQTPTGSAGSPVSFSIGARWRRPGGSSYRNTRQRSPVLTFAASDANSNQERDIAVSVEVARLWHAYILQQVALMNQEEKFSDAHEYAGFQLFYFKPYCRGLPGTDRLVDQLEQIWAVADQQWSPRAQREVHYRHRTSSRRQIDHRSAPRPEWQEYLPGRGRAPGPPSSAR